MVKGIDVSKYQGQIDFKKVKAAGIDFVIIRAGFGMSAIDEFFVRNINSAITAGMKIGVYWFVYALNMQQLRENAKRCIDVIAPYKDYINMKVWCDFEYDSDKYASDHGANFTPAMRTTMVNTFCDILTEHGYEAGIYANPDYLKNKFATFNKGYPLWLACYSKNKGAYDCFMWQYSSKGTVPGIKGNVDMNYLYGDVPGVKNDIYFCKYTGTSVSIVAALNAIGADSTFTYRRKIAVANGIKNYIGTATQNTLMLTLLKQGKLIRPN